MISELTFIRSYHTFWNSLFPGGEDYIRLINSVLVERFDKPLKIEDIPNRRALINGVSFSLFSTMITDRSRIYDIDSLSSNDKLLKKLVVEEKKSLSNLRYGMQLSSRISEQELRVIKAISKRLIQQYWNKQSLKVRPTFKGCGVLFEATGDIIYRDTLSEIKSGDRNFSIQDLRQLFVYLALNHQSNDFLLSKVELCNPRTGLIWREGIDRVSENIAGSSTIEVYNEIVNFVSNNNRSI